RLPSVVDAMIRQGHVIGNHSWNHPRFSGMRLSKIKEQIVRTEAQIDLAYARASTPRPIKVFRFPWGDKGAGTHPDGVIPPDAAVRVREIQALLRDTGFEQPDYPGVELPRFHGRDISTDADTWFTFDAMEWSLLSKNHKHGIENLDAVLARIDNYFREKRASIKAREQGEIIIIHDFEATRDTFIPILDRLIVNGARFMQGSRVHLLAGHGM
ncbi:MAG: polysaccharide deacetylase family protein, partial [Candidatus Lokiarchaeota archaeon]|nr:polysaccharide deacetylase family protein [Candidatus Lokiarchaeota archaeon]